MSRTAAKKVTEQIITQKNEDEKKIQEREAKELSWEHGLFDKVLGKLKNSIVSNTIKQLNQNQENNQQQTIQHSKQELQELQQQLAYAEHKEFAYEYKEGERETIELWTQYLDAFLPDATKEFLQDTFETESWDEAMSMFLTGEKDTDLLMMMATYVLDDASAIDTVLTIKTIHSQTLRNYTKKGTVKSTRKAHFVALQQEREAIVYPPAASWVQEPITHDQTIPSTSAIIGSGAGISTATTYNNYRRKKLSEFVLEPHIHKKYHHKVTKKFLEKNAHLALNYATDIPFSKVTTIGKLFWSKKPGKKTRWTLCSRNARLEADRIFSYNFHSGDAFDAMGKNPDHHGSPHRMGSLYHEHYQRFHGKKSKLLKSPRSWRTKEKQLGNDQDILSRDGNSTPMWVDDSNLIDIYVTGYSQYGHRAMWFKASDGIRYVLDPYRRDKTWLPRPYEEYKKTIEQQGTTIARVNFHKAEKQVVFDDIW